jgi:hypothetical protein
LEEATESVVVLDEEILVARDFCPEPFDGGVGERNPGVVYVVAEAVEGFSEGEVCDYVEGCVVLCC